MIHQKLSFYNTMAENELPKKMYIYYTKPIWHYYVYTNCEPYKQEGDKIIFSFYQGESSVPVKIHNLMETGLSKDFFNQLFFSSQTQSKGILLGEVPDKLEDTDKDGVYDNLENYLGLNKTSKDSDTDRIEDYFEVKYGIPDAKEDPLKGVYIFPAKFVKGTDFNTHRIHIRKSDTVSAPAKPGAKVQFIIKDTNNIDFQTLLDVTDNGETTRVKGHTKINKVNGSIIFEAKPPEGRCVWSFYAVPETGSKMGQWQWIGSFNIDSLGNSIESKIHGAESLAPYAVVNNNFHDYGFNWAGEETGKIAIDKGPALLKFNSNRGIKLAVMMNKTDEPEPIPVYGMHKVIQKKNLYELYLNPYQKGEYLVLLFGIDTQANGAWVYLGEVQILKRKTYTLPFESAGGLSRAPYPEITQEFRDAGCKVLSQNAGKIKITGKSCTIRFKTHTDVDLYPILYRDSLKAGNETTGLFTQDKKTGNMRITIIPDKPGEYILYLNLLNKKTSQWISGGIIRLEK